MELDSKEQKQRNCNAFLTAFVAITFTVALLEGAGLIFSYAHFQNANTRIAVLESQVLEVQARVSALEVSPLDSSQGDSPAWNKC